ncbi:MAG: class I SAM-dependent methyltransferase [Gammaproteobacteria bacterium]
MSQTFKAGDFTGLAADYSQNRPDYCASVLKALLGLFDKPVSEIDFVDVGAGTGIWTRMVLNAGVKSVIAIEPNDDMRANGVCDTKSTSIFWQTGSAEDTGISSNSVDWITMASSFHWTNFDAATKEFHRVLRIGGRFTALWNPRLIELNPLFSKIESHLAELRPGIKRVSSGRSGITETLTEQLWASPFFDDVVYIEGRHEIVMTPQRYLGAWRSVNDLRVQLGGEKFNAFLEYVEREIQDQETIKATYLTRAWSARKI